MRPVTFEELRDIQLGLLDAVDAFCKKNDLRYSLGGGTLLGAIRHKGFIPWDDDVDIMMPRPDYNFFLNNFTHNHISLQHLGNNEVYIPFCKVFDTRTVLFEHYATNGVFIDLFPIDGLPPESKIDEYCKYQHHLFQNLYQLHDYKTSAYLQYDKSMPEFLVRLKYWVKHLFYISRKRCIKKISILHGSFPFETSDYAGAICGAYGQKEHMKKEVFIEYIPLLFETRKYMCISKYHDYLTKHYGDYMQLPPVDKQKATHHYSAYWKD